MSKRAAISTTRRRGKWSRRLRGGLTSVAFCSPAVLLYAGFVILPGLLGFTYALTDWTGWESGGDPADLAECGAHLLRLQPAKAGEAMETFLGAKFIGLENFRELAEDTTFLGAPGTGQFRRTVVGFTLFQTALIVLAFTFVSLILAVLLDKLRRMKGLIRGLFFYPYVLSLLDLHMYRREREPRAGGE